MNVWCKTSTILGIRLFGVSFGRAFRTAVLLVVGVALITTLTIIAEKPASANVGRTISFQGRLLSSDKTPVDDGYYNIEFKLYQGGTGSDPGNPGGSLRWTETYINNNSTTGAVKVVDGRFAVSLGSNTPFGDNIDWSSKALWLSMNVAGSAVACTAFDSYPCVADGEMTPMKQLTATPYAMSAGSIGNKTIDQLLHLGQGSQEDVTNESSISINKTGSGNLIDLKNNGNDVLKVTNSGDIAFGGGKDSTISVEPSGENEAGKKLTISAGSGGGGDGTSGGELAITGGSAGGTSGNGGNITISGGNGTGTGASGLVVINTPAFKTIEDDAACYTDGENVSSSCELAQSTVDNAAAAIIGFSENSQTATIPDPTVKTAGKLFYITASSDSKQFKLVLNNGEIEANVRPSSTVSLFWSGAEWTIASGAISSDRLSVNDDENQESPNVKIGNDNSSETTLLTVDKAGEAPEITDEELLGSIYYDTTLGKIQCYEANGWGDCASSPDKFINLSPEYTNAVTNGSTSGTLTSDFCSDTLSINTNVCSSNETKNFYNWTSSEAASQTKSIYVNWQLPKNFKEFIADSLSLEARTDSVSSSVSYTVYRSSPDSPLVACGVSNPTSTGIQTSWTKSVASGSSDPANCTFSAGDTMVLKIDMAASNDANAYVGNLSFAYK